MTWARLLPAADLSPRRLRQGAWYPIAGTHVDGRIIIAVGTRRVALPEVLLEVTDRPPVRFTVVWRRRYLADESRGTPADFGCAYAVCPGCAARVPLEGRQSRVLCPSCGHPGRADWDTIH